MQKRTVFRTRAQNAFRKAVEGHRFGSEYVLKRSVDQIRWIVHADEIAGSCTGAENDPVAIDGNEFIVAKEVAMIGPRHPNDQRVDEPTFEQDALDSICGGFEKLPGKEAIRGISPIHRSQGHHCDHAIFCIQQRDGGAGERAELQEIVLLTGYGERFALSQGHGHAARSGDAFIPAGTECDPVAFKGGATGFPVFESHENAFRIGDGKAVPGLDRDSGELAEYAPTATDAFGHLFETGGDLRGLQAKNRTRGIARKAIPFLAALPGCAYRTVSSGLGSGHVFPRGEP